MFDVERFLGLRRVNRQAVAPDGSWVCVKTQQRSEDGATFVTALWRVSLQNGSTEPLFAGEEHSHSHPAFQSDGTLLFLSDRPTPIDPEPPKPKPKQLWCLPPSAHEPRVLTDEPLGVQGFLVAKQGDRVVLLADHSPDVPEDDMRSRARDRQESGPSAIYHRQMPVRFWDHWLGPDVPRLVVLDAKGRRVLEQPKDGRYREQPWALSPDGRVLAMGHQRVASDRIDEDVITLTNLDTDEVIRELSHARTTHVGLVFSPDGQQLAMTRRQRKDGHVPRPLLVVHGVNDGVERQCLTAWDHWPTPEAWSEHGLLVTADVRGCHQAYLLSPLDAAEPTPIGPTNTVGSLAWFEDTLIGISHGLCQPPEVFRHDQGQTPQSITALTGISATELEDMVDHEVFEVPSTDGAPIHTRLLRPKGKSRGTLFWIHGGPVSHWADWWHWRWNPMVFVAQGYAVALPNPRGSTGFGTAFAQGIWHNRWGEHCYLDLMAVADALEARNDLGPMACMGGSFGGYMSNWMGGHTDRFKAVVTHASIFDNRAFSLTTDMPAYWAYQLGVTAFTDPEATDRYSPHRVAPNWRTPTLVIHGEKDYRCPIGEGLALFEALQQHGVESEILVFPDEGHWIQKPRNITTWHCSILDFFERHL